jgi:tRNA A37 threonylcarbamoyladenosine dehydratase
VVERASIKKIFFNLKQNQYCPETDCSVPVVFSDQHPFYIVSQQKYCFFAAETIDPKC